MNERDIAEWNGAGDYLNRINMSLLQAGDAAMRLDLYQWLHSLKLFYREISSVMKEEEKTALYSEAIMLSEQINKHLRAKARRKKQVINTKLIESIEQFEIKLREIYKKSGLQMRLQEDASRALR